MSQIIRLNNNNILFLPKVSWQPRVEDSEISWRGIDMAAPFFYNNITKHKEVNKQDTQYVNRKYSYGGDSLKFKYPRKIQDIQLPQYWIKSLQYFSLHLIQWEKIYKETRKGSICFKYLIQLHTYMYVDKLSRVYLLFSILPNFCIQ